MPSSEEKKKKTHTHTLPSENSEINQNNKVNLTGSAPQQINPLTQTQSLHKSVALFQVQANINSITLGILIFLSLNTCGFLFFFNLVMEDFSLSNVLLTDTH